MSFSSVTTRGGSGLVVVGGGVIGEGNSVYEAQRPTVLRDVVA